MNSDTPVICTSGRTPLCDELGAGVPIFGFTHSLDAAIAISRHGGIGVWGATRSTPDEIEAGLTRMDVELGELPYGIDLVIPPGMPERDNRAEIEAAIPGAHRGFVAALRERFDIPDDGEPGIRSRFVRSEATARDRSTSRWTRTSGCWRSGSGAPSGSSSRRSAAA